MRCVCSSTTIEPQVLPGTRAGRPLKIGAQIRVTARKVWIALSSACPYQPVFAHVLARLHALPILARAP